MDSVTSYSSSSTADVSRLRQDLLAQTEPKTNSTQTPEANTAAQSATATTTAEAVAPAGTMAAAPAGTSGAAPAGAAVTASAGAASAETEEVFDDLDINEDGIVSASERAAGEASLSSSSSATKTTETLSSTQSLMSENTLSQLFQAVKDSSEPATEDEDAVALQTLTNQTDSADDAEAVDDKVLTMIQDSLGAQKQANQAYSNAQTIAASAQQLSAASA